MTSIAIVSDFHAGSEAGLWPDVIDGERQTLTPLHRGLLQRYRDSMAVLFPSPPDILIVNGDAIDGRQLRGKGAGDADILHEQIAAACELVKMWKAKRIFIIAGTQYHVGGDAIECEAVLAKMLREGGANVEFHRKLNLTVNGWFRLQCRHHIGSSSVPHGRFTAQNRSRIWGIINAAANQSKPPHLSVYSHVHYYTFSEDDISATMTTPAWQAIGSRYGDERCDGRCVLGSVRVDVGRKESDSWGLQKRLYKASVADRSVRV